MKVGVLVMVLVALVSVDAAASDHAREREPLVGGPCEGCEAVFEWLPDTLSAVAAIAPASEPGEPMRIDGRVFDSVGNPVSGVIVYAYQTDADGVYPSVEETRGTSAYRHGRLRAWAQTDADGRYRFDTIRPASYPDTRILAHVHMHVIEPGRCTYYIESIEFMDDPLLSQGVRRQGEGGRGGSGFVMPAKDEGGTWIVDRDIILGKNVPGYLSHGE